MRDGRLSAASRAIVVRSCDLLSDGVLPFKLNFKSYIPQNSDSPLLRVPLPRSYDENGNDMTNFDSLADSLNSIVAIVQPTESDERLTSDSQQDISNNDTHNDNESRSSCSEADTSTRSSLSLPVDATTTESSTSTSMTITLSNTCEGISHSPPNESQNSNAQLSSNHCENIVTVSIVPGNEPDTRSSSQISSPTAESSYTSPSSSTNVSETSSQLYESYTSTSSTSRSLQSSTEKSTGSVGGIKVHNHQWMEDYRYIDCEWSMRTMDKLYNASFVDFVRNEKNCEFTGRHLATLVKDYRLQQVVNGIEWVIAGWSIETTARLLKNVFDDWLPELAAFAIAKIGFKWPLRPKMGLIVAYLMMGESPGIVALFLRSLTVGWDASSITELVSCLDTVLEWDDQYFRNFCTAFLKELVDGKERGEIRNIEPKELIQSLESMYKTTATMSNFRIVIADLRLAVAKSTYLMQFTHSISCSECMNHRPCSFTASTLIPTPSSILAATRNQAALNLLAASHQIPASVRNILGLQPNSGFGSGSLGSGLDSEGDGSGWMTPPSLTESRSLASMADEIAGDSYFSNDLLAAIPSDISLNNLNNHEDGENRNQDSESPSIQTREAVEQTVEDNSRMNPDGDVLSNSQNEEHAMTGLSRVTGTGSFLKSERSCSSIDFEVTENDE